MCSTFVALAFALGGYLGLWAGRRKSRAEWLERAARCADYSDHYSLVGAEKMSEDFVRGANTMADHMAATIRQLKTS